MGVGGIGAAAGLEDELVHAGQLAQDQVEVVDRLRARPAACPRAAAGAARPDQRAGRLARPRGGLYFMVQVPKRLMSIIPSVSWTEPQVVALHLGLGRARAAPADRRRAHGRRDQSRSAAPTPAAMSGSIGGKNCPRRPGWPISMTSGLVPGRRRGTSRSAGHRTDLRDGCRPAGRCRPRRGSRSRNRGRSGPFRELGRQVLAAEDAVCSRKALVDRGHGPAGAGEVDDELLEEAAPNGMLHARNRRQPPRRVGGRAAGSVSPTSRMPCGPEQRHVDRVGDGPEIDRVAGPVLALLAHAVGGLVRRGEAEAELAGLRACSVIETRKPLYSRT